MTSWPVTVRVEARLFRENPDLERWLREAVENVDLEDDTLNLQLVHSLHLEGYEVEVYPQEDVESLSGPMGARMEGTMRIIQARVEDTVERVLRTKQTTDEAPRRLALVARR